MNTKDAKFIVDALKLLEEIELNTRDMNQPLNSRGTGDKILAFTTVLKVRRLLTSLDAPSESAPRRK